MKRYLSAFAAGVLFAIGLGISGMTQPEKVIGFLDVFGKWDPALMFVMGGAVVVYGVGFRFVQRMKRPVFVPKFNIPTKSDITPRMIVGASLFGIGWGIVGLCPGPALVSLATFSAKTTIFVGAMIFGMIAFRTFDARLSRADSVE